MAKKMKGASLADSTPSGAHLEQDPMKDFETREHLDTLIKAHGIMSDPEKMAKVHKLAGRHHKAIKSIQDIKDARDNFSKKAMVVDADGEKE